MTLFVVGTFPLSRRRFLLLSWSIFSPLAEISQLNNRSLCQPLLFIHFVRSMVRLPHGGQINIIIAKPRVHSHSNARAKEQWTSGVFSFFSLCDFQHYRGLWRISAAFVPGNGQSVTDWLALDREDSDRFKIGRSLAGDNHRIREFISHASLIFFFRGLEHKKIFIS